MLFLLLALAVGAHATCNCHKTDLGIDGDGNLMFPIGVKHLCLMEECPEGLDPNTVMVVGEGTRISLPLGMFITTEGGETVVYHEDPETGELTRHLTMYGNTAFVGTPPDRMNRPTGGIYVVGAPTAGTVGDIWIKTHETSYITMRGALEAKIQSVYSASNPGLSGVRLSIPDGNGNPDLGNGVVVTPHVVITGKPSPDTLAKNGGSTLIVGGITSYEEVDVLDTHVRCSRAYPTNTESILEWHAWSGTSTCVSYKQAEHTSSSLQLDASTCYDLDNHAYLSVALGNPVGSVKFPGGCEVTGSNSLAVLSYSDNACASPLTSPTSIPLGSCVGNKAFYSCSSNT